MSVLGGGIFAVATLFLMLPSPDGFEWENDFATARERAQKEGKPLLVVFR